MPPPVGPPSNPHVSEAIKLFVGEHYEQHPKSDLLHPDTFHKVWEFLAVWLSIRGSYPQTLNIEHFRAWVCTNEFS